MPNLTLLGWMFLAWSVVTGLLGLLWIYRSVVGMKEEDQLFLDAAESRFQDDQQLILAKLERIRPLVKALGIASGSLLAAMLLVVLYLVATGI